MLSGGLVHQHHVLTWNLATPPEALCDAVEAGLAVEHDVGRVTAVVPGGKARIVGLEAGHHAKPAPRAQQGVEAGELGRREVEMLDDLGAGDEIVAARKHRRVGREAGIVDRHPMTGRAQHRRQRRPRTAAVVESLGTRRQALQQGRGEARQKAQVAGIVGVVVVEQVFGALVCHRRPLFRRHEGGFASVAAPVIPPIHMHEGARRGLEADRTGEHRSGSVQTHAPIVRSHAAAAHAGTPRVARGRFLWRQPGCVAARKTGQPLPRPGRAGCH